jgi:transcriptional repressor NrdR
MECPSCGLADSKVLDSRPSDDGKSIRRRRECNNCRHRFTTYERVEERPILVIKRSGNREQFDADKLLAGIMRACEKRPVSMKKIEAVVENIENAVREGSDREASSQLIGEMVMQQLRALDPVAYVRFASVYQDFEDLNSFIRTIEQLENERVPS